jgi:hypothetical protein
MSAKPGALPGVSIRTASAFAGAVIAAGDSGNADAKHRRCDKCGGQFLPKGFAGELDWGVVICSCPQD